MLASLLTLRPLHRLALLLLLAPSALLLSALTFAAPALERTGPAALPTLVLEPLATGFLLPVGIVSAGDTRLFIVEKRGIIQIVQPDGQILEPPFLDIRDLVRAEDQEQGLLGLVFAPNDPTTFYVNYINKAPAIVNLR